MLIERQNIRFAGDIAGLFCQDNANRRICWRSIVQRLINNFTDETFNSFFLPNLSASRFYAYNFSFVASGFGLVKLLLNGNDIVTGSVKTGEIPGISVSKKNDFVWIAGYITTLFRRSKPNASVSFIGIENGKLILMVTGFETPYGIVFIPPTVGNGGTPGGKIYVDPGEQRAYEETQSETEEEASGFDIKKLIIPALIAASYFLIS